MTDIELLPCPFCGGKASMMHSYPCWVECVSCGADTPDSAPVDEDGAAAAWNTRANVAHATAAKDAEIERLRVEVRELRKRQAGWERHVAAAGCEYVRDGEHDALVNRRAERLAEALRDALEYLHHHLPDEALAPHRAALRDHGQEVRNG